MTLAESIGVENFHLFFLVPTGRGVKLTDISPEKYEEMITNTFAKVHKHRLTSDPPAHHSLCVSHKAWV